MKSFRENLISVDRFNDLVSGRILDCIENFVWRNSENEFPTNTEKQKDRREILVQSIATISVLVAACINQFVAMTAITLITAYYAGGRLKKAFVGEPNPSGIMKFALETAKGVITASTIQQYFVLNDPGYQAVYQASPTSILLHTSGAIVAGMLLPLVIPISRMIRKRMVVATGVDGDSEVLNPARPILAFLTALGLPQIHNLMHGGDHPPEIWREVVNYSVSALATLQLYWNNENPDRNKGTPEPVTDPTKA